MPRFAVEDLHRRKAGGRRRRPMEYQTDRCLHTAYAVIRKLSLSLFFLSVILVTLEATDVRTIFSLLDSVAAQKLSSACLKFDKYSSEKLWTPFNNLS